MKGIVLSLCDRTGIMCEPWLAAGYEALTVDIKQPLHAWPNTRTVVVCDVRRFHYPLRLPPPVIVFAFPPCTDLAISGARWFKEKGLAALIDSLSVVEACRNICEASSAPWMLENPIGTLSTYWRAPDHSFDPCDYGDPYTKRTNLWTGNGFVMPPKIRQGDLFAAPTCVEPSLGSLIYHMPDAEGRAERRSKTPIGFARAVFAANAKQRAEVA